MNNRETCSKCPVYESCECAEFNCAGCNCEGYNTPCAGNCEIMKGYEIDYLKDTLAERSETYTKARRAIRNYFVLITVDDKTKFKYADLSEKEAYKVYKRMQKRWGRKWLKEKVIRSISIKIGRGDHGGI